MTPNGLCDYILSGGIYEDCPSGDSDYAEMGKDIWPERMQRLVELAQRASKQDVKRESYRANMAMLIYNDQMAGAESRSNEPPTNLSTVEGCNLIADKLIDLIFK